MPLSTTCSQRAGVLAGFCMWMKVSIRWSAVRLRSRARPTIDSGVELVWLTQPEPREVVNASPWSAV